MKRRRKKNQSTTTKKKKIKKKLKKKKKKKKIKKKLKKKKNQPKLSQSLHRHLLHPLPLLLIPKPKFKKHLILPCRHNHHLLSLPLPFHPRKPTRSARIKLYHTQQIKLSPLHGLHANKRIIKHKQRTPCFPLPSSPLLQFLLIFHPADL